MRRDFIEDISELLKKPQTQMERYDDVIGVYVINTLEEANHVGWEKPHVDPCVIYYFIDAEPEQH